MADATQSFLEAEAAIKDLLDQVHRLKGEIEGYSTATRSLDDVRTDLAELLERLKHVSEGIETSVQTSRKIQTPEILNRIDLAIAETSKSSTAISSTVDERTKSVTREIDELKSRLKRTRTLLVAALIMTSIAAIAAVIAAAGAFIG